MSVLLQAGEVASELGRTPSETLLGLVQTLLALAAVCVLAWVVLRWGARRGLGLGASRGQVRVLERVPLDARRSLFLVKVGTRTLLVGTGDGAAPNVLRELEAGEVPELPDVPRVSFADVLRRLGGRSQ